MQNLDSGDLEIVIISCHNHTTIDFETNFSSKSKTFELFPLIPTFRSVSIGGVGKEKRATEKGLNLWHRSGASVGSVTEPGSS